MNIEQYGYQKADTIDCGTGIPARVTAVHRSHFEIVCRVTVTFSASASCESPRCFLNFCIFSPRVIVTFPPAFDFEKIIANKAFYLYQYKQEPPQRTIAASLFNA